MFNVNSYWYGLEKTLQRLDLVDIEVSITPQHLALYATVYASNNIPWDANLEDINEEDQEQMNALHYVDGIEKMIKLVATYMKAFKSDK